MKYALIKGSFHVVGQSPDADSIKFRAANEALWNCLDSENREAFNRCFAAEGGVVNLRLEGIDALETHYTPPSIVPRAAPGTAVPATPVTYKSKGYAQPTTLGRLATNQFLGWLGVSTVKWRTFGKNVYIDEATMNGRLVKNKLEDHIPGYIVTGDIEMNGRPVAWIFRGETDLPDGASLSREELASLVRESANYQLLKMGMVYPFFFMTLPAVIRKALAEAVVEAQTSAVEHAKSPTPPPNLWLVDYSTRGVNLTSVRVITEQCAIFPYLFRKIIRHYQQLDFERSKVAQPGSPIDDSVGLDSFFNDTNPHVFVISEQDFLHLDDVIEAKGMSLCMKKPPHDLVFLS